MKAQIRLACLYCHTDECDGIAAIPVNWHDVDEFQSYEESIKEIAADDTQRSPTEWYTHLGVCPECAKIYCCSERDSGKEPHHEDLPYRP